MRRVPIRMKLVAALVVPLSGLLVVTWLEVRAISAEVAEVRAQTDLVDTSLGPLSITTALQSERAAASLYIIGQEENFSIEVRNNAEARDRVDRAIGGFTETIEERGGRLAQIYAPAIDALAGLEDARAAVDATDDARRNLGNTAASMESFDRYSGIIQLLNRAQAQVVATIEDDDLRRGANLLGITNLQTDVMAELVTNLMIPAVSGDFRLADRSEVQAAAMNLSAIRANENDIAAEAQGVYAPAAERLFATDHIQQFPPFADEAIRSGTVDIGMVGPLSTGTDVDGFGYIVFREDVIDLLTDEVAEVRSAADARLERYVILGAFATVLAVGATVAVSRSITRPLRALTEQARTMARRSLPDAVRNILEAPLGDDVVVPRPVPIDVRSRDEVSDVADALNTVQISALELAVEQAVLRRNIADSFVNLGRRNQNLLSRQLDFITSLESQEADPDTLGSLFRLDHLATRMRRNAESLLVLAGIEPPRKWAAPLRISDVLRSALGEVEDYQRVQVRDVEPGTILGSAGTDVAHLVAEFVENALTFSSGEQGVEIRGRRRPEGGYTLAVIDNGFGMAESEMDRANRRLAGSESFTVAPSKYLGHYVAGHLAARHGITARLSRSPGGGVTVLIELPPSLMAPDIPDIGDVPEPTPRMAPPRVMTASLPPLPPAAPVPAPAPPAWSDQWSVPSAPEPSWAEPGWSQPGWSQPGWSEPGWSHPVGAEPDRQVGGWAAALGNAGVVPNPAVWTSTAPEPDAPDGGWAPAPPSLPDRHDPYASTGPTVEQVAAASGWPSRETGVVGDPDRPALVRRRPGSQAPGERIHRIPRGQSEVAPAPTRSPEDIHRIVTSFTAGVEQGRLRGRDARPPGG